MRNEYRTNCIGDSEFWGLVYVGAFLTFKQSAEVRKQGGLMLPPSPYRITERATQVGKLFSSVHNNYSAIYKDAYYGTPEKAVLNEWQEDLRQILSTYAQDLNHFYSRLKATQAAMRSTYGTLVDRQICSHCHERNIIPDSKWCNYCTAHAKDFGSLPTLAELGAKDDRVAKYGEGNTANFKRPPKKG